jgi:hypothetical protein
MQAMLRTMPFIGVQERYERTSGSWQWFALDQVLNVASQVIVLRNNL